MLFSLLISNAFRLLEEDFEYWIIKLCFQQIIMKIEPLSTSVEDNRLFYKVNLNE